MSNTRCIPNAISVDDVTARALFGIVHQIIERADQQQRDLTDFEAGRVDALLDVAGAVALPVRGSGASAPTLQRARYQALKGADLLQWFANEEGR